MKRKSLGSGMEESVSCLWEKSAKGLETDSHPWQAHLYFNLFLQKEDLSAQWKQKEWDVALSPSTHPPERRA